MDPMSLGSWVRFFFVIFFLDIVGHLLVKPSGTLFGALRFLDWPSVVEDSNVDVIKTGKLLSQEGILCDFYTYLVTLNNHVLIDVWWNHQFLCNDLESSNWNIHL